MKEKEAEVEARREVAMKVRRAEYRKELRQVFFGLPDDASPIDIVERYLAERADEFNRDEVSSTYLYEWKRIAYVATFDMRYYYEDVAYSTFPDGTEVCEDVSTYDYIDDARDQIRLRKLLIPYLMAGAKLAQRIGSKAYDDWAELLGEMQFKEISGGQLFTEEQFADFIRRHTRAFSRLWADNQVRRQNAAEKQLHTSTPHTRKKGGKTKK